MLVPFEQVGKLGLIKDIPDHQLPALAWSDARNVVFRNGYVQKSNGYSSLITPSVIPYALFPCPSSGSNFWAYAGLAKIYGFFGTAEANITNVGGDYIGGETDLWNGGMFNGIPVFNNGVDPPQIWSPISLAQPLVDLTNWTAGMLAKVVRPFKTYLVALDVSKGGVRDTRMVKWSHPADPGTVPSSWNETDPTKDAGEVSLADGEESLVDCLELGDFNGIYTETSFWLQSLSGNSYIFNFNKRLGNVGLLAQNCAKEFQKRHFVVTADDVVVHDGTRVESVIDTYLRKWLFSNLNSTVYFVSFVLPNYRDSEMWFCFPYGGGGLINMAAIWNWRFNSWTLRELPDIRAGHSSLYNPSGSVDLWDYAAAGDWATGTDTWGTTPQTSSSEVMLVAPRSLGGIYRFDTGLTQVGANYRSYVERTGLPLAGVTRDGTIILDPNRVKLLRSIWPRIEAANGVQLSVYVGGQMEKGEAITWKSPKTFTVGGSPKLDFYTSYRYLALRFEETAGSDWKLTSFDIDVAPTGAL